MPILSFKKYPFEELGSLDTPGTSYVGPLAQERLTNFTPSGMVLPGPFSSLEESHKYEIHLILDLVLREEMYSPQAVDAYLISASLTWLSSTMVSTKSAAMKEYSHDCLRRRVARTWRRMFGRAGCSTDLRFAAAATSSTGVGFSAFSRG